MPLGSRENKIFVCLSEARFRLDVRNRKEEAYHQEKGESRRG